MEYRRPPLSCLPEDDWINTCDILQALHIRKLPVAYSAGEVTPTEELDTIFSMRLRTVESIRRNPDEDDRPTDTLIYHWKQVAWVDSNQADQLADAFMEGFEDLIPVRPEWATFWHQRAEVLRSQPQWYRPIHIFGGDSSTGE